MSLTTTAAFIGFIATLWLFVFQILLVAGAPLGFLAWGGADPGRLPANKRLASAVSAALFVVVGSLFGQVLGWWTLWSGDALWWAFLIFSVLFLLSTIGNMSTTSRAERIHGVPLAFVLTVACMVQLF